MPDFITKLNVSLRMVQYHLSLIHTNKISTHLILSRMRCWK